MVSLLSLFSLDRVEITCQSKSQLYPSLDTQGSSAFLFFELCVNLQYLIQFGGLIVTGPVCLVTTKDDSNFLDCLS